MIPIRLEWKRPADGVELVHDEKLAARHMGGDGRAAQARSDRTIPATYEVVNLENPIVLHLINCQGDQDRLAFLARFGFLERWDVETGSISVIEDVQNRMSGALVWSASTFEPKTAPADQITPISVANHLMNEMGKKVSLHPSFEIADPGNTLRIVLKPDSLRSFMAMEIALAHEAGAVATACEHCSKYFLTGPLTGRRSHAKYCSDRCRVAAMRKRNATKAG